MSAGSDPHQASLADVRALFDRLRWASGDGCYATGSHFHVIARPAPADPEQRCTVVIAVRARRPERQIPPDLAFVLRSDAVPNLLHYARLNRIGQTQISGVAPGLLQARSGLDSSTALPAALQPALSAAWSVDAAGSAFAAEHDQPDVLQFQHASGDLLTRLHAEDSIPSLHIIAHSVRWDRTMVAVAWESTDADGQPRVYQSLLPLVWQQSLECWGGRMQLTTGRLLRFWPPQAPLDLAALASLPIPLIVAAVAAAASLPTRDAWQALSRDPRLPAPLRTAIENRLDTT